MNTSAKIAIGLSAVVVAGLMAVAVTPFVVGAEQPTAAADTTAPTHTPSPEADPADVPEGYVDVGHGTYIPGGGSGECESSTYIWIGSDNGEPMHAEMEGADLVDTGPREFALGEVGLDEQGRPLTYTVAPGDVLTRIGDRFCIYNGGMLSTLNNYLPGNAIQPGDVLTLNADYATDFVYPYPME